MLGTIFTLFKTNNLRGFINESRAKEVILINYIQGGGNKNFLQRLILNLPTTTIVAQPFNVIKWQLKFNPVA